MFKALDHHYSVTHRVTHVKACFSELERVWDGSLREAGGFV